MNSTTATHSTYHRPASWEQAVQPSPRLRLLHHVDLARLGDSTPDTIPLVAGEWQSVGRNAPFFGAPGHERPLDDPSISRDQLRVRWLAEKNLFEIEPNPSAKRQLTAFIDDRFSVGRGVTTRVELPPGASVAIGDRALLGLEVVRPRSRTADRMGLVGESEAIWTLRDEVTDIGAFDRPALIMGPTGSGKELVARAIHAAGSRSRGPFVPLNCAALPEQLVESMLFGHIKGAFTGADRASAGLFAAAEGGTLFLDELGELPIAVQPKLLRVLQDGRATPVGAHEGRLVNFRLVAATHRELRHEVAAGRLREDLFHRVAAHVVHVPPLSARRFDIPQLFVHVLMGLVRQHPELSWLMTGADGWRPTLPQSYMVALMSRSWTGNVREVQNVVEQVARLNLRPGPFRSPEPPEPLPDASTPQTEGSTPSGQSEGVAAYSSEIGTIATMLGLALKTVSKLLEGPYRVRARDALSANTQEESIELLKDVASDAIFSRLEEHDFNQSKVAASLGTSRTTLVKLMRDLGLRRATDLTLEEIEQAQRAQGGDLERAARALKVSPQALKKQITLLRLRTSG